MRRLLERMEGKKPALELNDEDFITFMAELKLKDKENIERLKGEKNAKIFIHNR